MNETKSNERSDHNFRGVAFYFIIGYKWLYAEYVF